MTGDTREYKAISEKELAHVPAEHEEWVKLHEKWDGTEGAPADLSRVALNGADLSSRQLVLRI